MPVAFRPASHPANNINYLKGYDGVTPDAFLELLSTELASQAERILQSSLKSRSLMSPSSIRPERTGFIGTVMAAYNTHHALVIRPDDVWLAILWCVQDYL